MLITNENQAADLSGVHVPASEVSGDDVTDKGYLQLAEQLKEQYPNFRYIALTERRTFGAEDNSFCAKLYDGKNLDAIEYLSKEREFYALLYSSLKPEEESSSPENKEEDNLL